MGKHWKSWEEDETVQRELAAQASYRWLNEGVLEEEAELIQVPLSCQHLHQQIPTSAPGCLLASSYTSDRAVVDISIYLDPLWLTHFEAAIYQPKFLFAWEPRKPTLILVNWPDMAAIDVDLFCHLVSYAAKGLKTGKTVEVGCISGHGRTGTLAAGIIAQIEGMKGDEAIASIRERYCKKAVENQKQEELIKQAF